jgi:tRNA(Ile)-lysidine synthase
LKAVALAAGLVQQIAQCIAAYPLAPHYWLAYSGGLDSQVLLHSLGKWREQDTDIRLTAVHINHQLQPEAADWLAFCRAQAQRLNIDFMGCAVDARPASGESPEAAARQARYRALQDLVAPNDVVLTAHHQTDQAETLLLQLLRGAGPAGLAAMPQRRAFGRGWLMRPLLDCRRDMLLACAQDWGLDWIEDRSNHDERFERNFLRHQLVPLLQQRWPGMDKTLARSAQLAGEATELLADLAQMDLAHLGVGQEGCLAASKLKGLSGPRQRNVLRCWLQQQGLSLPSQAQLEQLSQQMLTARQDAQPWVTWPGGEVRRYRDRLYALALNNDQDSDHFDNTEIIAWPWPEQQWLPLPGGGRLSWVKACDGGLDPRCLQALSVRFRRGGERFQPVGRQHSQGLKKILQQIDLPPWERARLPLLYSAEQLVWVAGLGPAAQYCVPNGQQGLQLQWHKIGDSASL